MPSSPARRRLSLDGHVARIQSALGRTREAFFDLVLAIKDAADQLDIDVFQKDLARRLSMPPSTLSKFLMIAECAPLLKRQRSLPPALTTLYDLARLHGILTKVYGDSDGRKRFEGLLTSKRIGPATEAREIAPLIQEAKQRASHAASKKRERAILTLGSDSIAVTAKSIKTLKQLLASRVVFRTILMTPSRKLLHGWSDDGFFVSQIAESYPIADLRAPSQAETVQGFVYAPSDMIDAGLKLLSASGFKFRDFFVPHQPIEGFVRFGGEMVLLRGERGQPLSFSASKPTREALDGALDVAASLGQEPRLLAFADDVVEGWTCVSSDPV